MMEESVSAQNQNTPSPASNTLLKILALFGILFMVAGSAYAGYLHGARQIKPGNPEALVPVSQSDQAQDSDTDQIEKGQEAIAYYRDIGEIWVMDFEGNNKRSIVVATKKGKVITQSPDWQKIAFTDDRDGLGAELWIVDITGKNLKKISSEAYPEEKGYYGGTVSDAIVWSPDSKKIKYTAETFTSETEGQVYKQQLTKKGKGGVAGPYLYNIDTGDKQKLPEEFVGKVFWSPDSLYVYSGMHFTDGLRDKVKKFDIVGKKLTASYPADFYECNYQFSPDGLYVFSFNSRGDWENQISYVQFRDSDFRNKEIIAKGSWQGYPSPKVSPDGKRVAYPSDDGVIQIYEFDTKVGYEIANARIGRRYSTHTWLNDNEILYWYPDAENSNSHGGDLYKVNVDTKKVTPLTDTKDVWVL